MDSTKGDIWQKNVHLMYTLYSSKMCKLGIENTFVTLVLMLLTNSFELAPLEGAIPAQISLLKILSKQYQH